MCSTEKLSQSEELEPRHNDCHGLYYYDIYSLEAMAIN